MLMSYVPEQQLHSNVLSELDAEPYDVLSRHWELENKYGRMYRSAGMFPPEALASAKEELKQSSQALCRCLRDSPVAFGVLQNNHLERSSSAIGYIQAFLELKGTYASKLSRTNEEEVSRQEFMRETLTKTQAAEESKKALEQYLESERRAKEGALVEGHHMIGKLTTDLHALKLTNEASNASLEHETRADREKNEQDHAQAGAAGEAAISDLDVRLTDKLKSGGDDEAVIRRRRGKVDEALQEMIAKYDADMGGLADKMKDVQEKFNTELKQFEELKEYFERIDLDKSIEASEEEELRLEKQKEKEAEARIEKIVTHLQARYRGNKTRENHDAGKGKGGKKGKKKGGGGGGSKAAKAKKKK